MTEERTNRNRNGRAQSHPCIVYRDCNSGEAQETVLAVELVSIPGMVDDDTILDGGDRLVLRPAIGGFCLAKMARLRC